jgi:hypothetical protein
MNLNQIQALVARLTDDQLMQELNQPSGVAPPQILAAEMQRRSMMRDGQPQQPQGYADGGQVALPAGMRDAIGLGYDLYGNVRNAAGLANSLYGVSGDPMTLGQAKSQAEDLYGPDLISPVIQQLADQEQADYDKAKRSGKGRALMEAGLAMMQSRDPSFLGAVGAGGQAGLAAKDRIDAQNRALMQGLMQAKLAQAQTQAQRNAALVGAATGIYGQDQNKRQAAVGAAIGLGQGQSANAMNIAQLYNARDISAANNAAQIKAAGIGAGAQVEAAKIQAAASMARAGASLVKPDDLNKMLQDEMRRIQTSFYGDGPGKMPTAKVGMKDRPTPQQVEQIAKNNIAVQLIGQGIQPPSDFITAMKVVQTARTKQGQQAPPAGTRPATGIAKPASLSQSDIDAMAARYANLTPR